MKYKKQIVVICLFTFLFIPFSKPQEPKAEVVALTSGVILACAGLALTTGLVITNPDMLVDVGERVYEGIKNIEGVFETVGDKIKINVTDFLLRAVIDDVISKLPTEDFDKEVFEDFEINFPMAKGVIKEFDNKIGSCIVINDGSVDSTLLYQAYDIGGSGGYVVTVPGQKVNISWDFTGTYGRYRVDNGEWYYGGNAIKDRNFSVKNNTYNSYLRVVGYSNYGSVCIPYRDYNTESVSSDKTKEYFPSGTGGISVPFDRPITGNPSVDIPFDRPGDILQEGDLEVDVDAPPIDTPDTGDSIFDKFGEWLKSLLNSLFGPLIKLLTNILDFLKNLFIPKDLPSLNFSPLYVEFNNKFPFCIPFDVFRLLGDMKKEPIEPVFYVDMKPFDSDGKASASNGEVGFELDLTEFKELFNIINTFILITFIISLAFKTRDIIK